MDGVYAISTRGDGRAVWAAWWTELPAPAPFVPPDARGEASDEHAAQREVLQAFSRVRGCRTRRQIDGRFALAADRWAHGVDPPFPGARRRAARGHVAAPSELPRDAVECLGLTPPFTFERAREAYRRRALEDHPDRGGSHGDILALNDAWQRVRKMLEPR